MQPNLDLSWAVSTATRAMPGESVCGDGVWVREGEGGLQLAVIDGLGHGKGAAEARKKTVDALDSIEERAWGSLVGVLKRLHRIIRGTRGAAVSLLDVGPRGVTFSGVGNVACESTIPDFKPFPRQGILGYRYRMAVDTRVPLAEGSLVLYTDGLDRIDLAACAGEPTEGLAEQLIERHGRGNDDMGVAVIRVVRCTDGR